MRYLGNINLTNSEPPFRYGDPFGGACFDGIEHILAALPYAELYTRATLDGSIGCDTYDNLTDALAAAHNKNNKATGLIFYERCGNANAPIYASFFSID